MKYEKTVFLPDGEACLLRNAGAADAQAVLDVFRLTHAQTENLLTYPDESGFTLSQEQQLLAEQEESIHAIEICAFIGGQLAGTAGFEPVGTQEKVRHRADFGIAIDRAFWGRGIGRALTGACIGCARQAGYSQLELNVVAENTGAVALYRSLGFVEYGRNPRGFRARGGRWQELVLMRLELEP